MTKFTRNDYILQCLAEECMEVGQRISKSLRFGSTEVQPNTLYNNITRISAEVNDLLGMIDLSHQEIPGFAIVEEQLEAKKVKFEKFFEYSKSLGIIEE